MDLKVKFTYFLLSICSILAEDIANKSIERSQADENDFSNVSSTRRTGLTNMRTEKSDMNPKISIISRIANSNLTVRPKSQLNNQNPSYNDSKHDSKVAETRRRRGRRYPTNFGDSDIFEELENDFSFDEMGSDVRGYDSYHGGPSNHKNKRKKRRGPPRYPPIDRDTLYEVGLLIYLRDFHLGMII